jgi:hypothetical protein
MKNNRRAKALLMGVFAATSWASAQFTQNGVSGWWRTNPTSPDIGRGVAIGNLTATPFPAAFQIHGELMPAGNNTPEVFRTNAPTTGSTYWRMFQDGTTAGFERGQLFADPSATHFNINAPQGHLRLHTNTVERMRVNQSGSITTNGYATQRAGFLGLSPNGSLWSSGQSTFSRLHLDDATGVLTSTYRPWMRNGVYMSGNMDMMYVGQLFRTGDDESDAVIAWGDNKYAPAGPDHLRFIFMGSGFEGEEVTRINGDGFHGLGNFDAAG